MRIIRSLSLSEAQFLGCVDAFLDSLHGELNSALMYLRKMEGRPKGAAFAFEMRLDQHRYGALLVLERWTRFLETFQHHTGYARHQALFDGASAKGSSAEKLVEQANHLIDAAPDYSPDLVEACALTFRTIEKLFAEERRAAAEARLLAAADSSEFQESRGVFLGDLAAR